MHICIFIFPKAGISLGMHPANERHRYKVTTSLIGWSLLKHINLVTVRYIHIALATQTAWHMWHPWNNSLTKILQTFRTIMPLFTFCCSLRGHVSYIKLNNRVGAFLIYTHLHDKPYSAVDDILAPNRHQAFSIHHSDLTTSIVSCASYPIINIFEIVSF